MFSEIAQGVHALDFSLILEKAKVIKVGDSFIEIPGIIIFRKKKSLIQQFLNPGINIIPINDNNFKNMLELIQKNCSSLGISGESLPKSKVFINFSKLLDDIFIIEEFKDTIKLNNLIFTKNSNEYHGSSIAGFQVFLVTEEEYDIISGFINVYKS